MKYVKYVIFHLHYFRPLACALARGGILGQSDFFRKGPIR